MENDLPPIELFPTDTKTSSDELPPISLFPSAAASSAQPSDKVDTSYITQKATEFGLDPNAVIGVARNEGLSGGVGDNGTSFGPFQLHAGGALPAEVWQKGAEYAKQWAWSTEGIDYALKKMGDNGARGRKGADAVRSIVLQFERPANPEADLRSGYAAVGGSN